MESAWPVGRNRSVWVETGMRRCNAASSPIDRGPSPVDTTIDRDGLATASAAAVGCRFAGGHPRITKIYCKIAEKCCHLSAREVGEAEREGNSMGDT